MQKKANRINAVSSSEVYAGGVLTQISVSDLKDNEVAINQLLNNHNILQQELKDLRIQNQQLERELTITRISPFVTWISIVVNVIGTMLIAIGTSLNTEELRWLFILLVCLGAVCLLCASIAVAFYKPISRRLIK